MHVIYGLFTAHSHHPFTRENARNGEKAALGYGVIYDSDEEAEVMAGESNFFTPLNFNDGQDLLRLAKQTFDMALYKRKLHQLDIRYFQQALIGKRVSYVHYASDYVVFDFRNQSGPTQTISFYFPQHMRPTDLYIEDAEIIGVDGDYLQLDNHQRMFLPASAKLREYYYAEPAIRLIDFDILPQLPSEVEIIDLSSPSLAHLFA